MSNDKNSIPWTEWMLRYVASDDSNALNDLIWSVGGSPPYGGISYDEAAAVYDLVEQFYGQGQRKAPESAYDRVKQFVQAFPEKLYTLEVFQCHERITNAPDDFSNDDVLRGLELCDKLNHNPAKAFFLTLAAQLLYRDGKIGKAKDILLDVLPTFLYLASQDPVYLWRARTTIQNSISFAVMDGDFSTARELLGKFGQFIPAEVYEQLRTRLGDEPKFDQK